MKRLWVHSGAVAAWQQEEASTETEDSTDCSSEGSPSFEWRRTLPLNESIYDETFIVPLYRGRQKGGGWRFSRSVLAHTLTLLALNFFLQVVVVVKVKALSDERSGETSEGLSDVCKTLTPADLRFKTSLPVQPADQKYFDCGPLSVTVMTRVVQLDRNGDGFWTEAEALQLQEELEKRLSRLADMPRAFRGFIKLVRKGGMRAQLEESAGGAAAATRTALARAAAATRNFTALPMTWMHKEEQILEMCQVADNAICSNMEVRGMLSSRLAGPEPGPRGTDDRIDLCEDIISNYCKDIFGERYKHHRYRSHQFCGEARADWDVAKRVRSVVYENSEKYVTSKDGVLRRPYFMFLFVILLIWSAAMLKECRDIMMWWFIILHFPVQTDPQDQICTVKDGRIHIHVIPRSHKYLTIVVNLIPRMLIWFVLMLVGTIFLIRADDYDDLILNSVALGFLIEVDNMLFAAVVSDKCKQIFSACEPCTVKAQRHGDWRDKGANQTLFYTVAIIVIVSISEYCAYFAPQGKFLIGRELICLCQVSGFECLGAQILGGEADLPSLTIMF